MKKIKIVLMSAAIAAAICSAFVTKPDPDCSDAPQYYYQNGFYYPAGIMGENFDCDNGSEAVTCTYWRPDPAGHPYNYAFCHYGNFFPINIATQAKK